MAESHPNTDIDPKEVESAHSMWHNFTTLVKYSSVAIAAVLLLMLLFVY